MKLCTMYKIVNTPIDFPNAPVELRRIPYSSRNLHSLTLLDHQSKTNSFSASFSPSTCKSWNKLNCGNFFYCKYFNLFIIIFKKPKIIFFFIYFLFGCMPCVSMCILVLCVSVQLVKLFLKLLKLLQWKSLIIQTL